MRSGTVQVSGEADGGNICNLTVQHGLYYLPISITNGFDLSVHHGYRCHM